MSRNLTDGVERPFRVLIDELDERIDLAGAGLDAVEEIEPERCLEWLSTR